MSMLRSNPEHQIAAPCDIGIDWLKQRNQSRDDAAIDTAGESGWTSCGVRADGSSGMLAGDSIDNCDTKIN